MQAEFLLLPSGSECLFSRGPRDSPGMLPEWVCLLPWGAASSCSLPLSPPNRTSYLPALSFPSGAKEFSNSKSEQSPPFPSSYLLRLSFLFPLHPDSGSPGPVEELRATPFREVVVSCGPAAPAVGPGPVPRWWTGIMPRALGHPGPLSPLLPTL